MSLTFRRLWLIFAQWVTVAVAVLFVVQTLRPEWLGGRSANVAAGKEVVVNQARPGERADAVLTREARPDSYRDAVQRAVPAVVNIYTTKAIKAPRNPMMNDPIFQRFFGDMPEGETRRSSSLGSGVVVSGKGYVLTNNHVVEAADGIEIAFADGKKLPAKVVGTDPETDLAVLKTEGMVPAAITLGAQDSLRVGDVVLAIGNPFGVGQTVTMGMRACWRRGVMMSAGRSDRFNEGFISMAGSSASRG